MTRVTGSNRPPAASRPPQTVASETDLLVSKYDERRTMQAWETLLSGETESTRKRYPVRSLIHESWSRCASGGINASQTEAPLNKAIDDLVRHNRDLLAAARRSLTRIGRLLDGTGAMLVLADRNGVLIDAIGDKRTIHDGMDINLTIGGKWTEDVIGTNGIGTALWAGAPVFVHAAEHFCAGIKSWTCAGAPIRDPLDNSIIGVVDLSGHPDIFRPHNTALVATAAQEIEKALAEQQNEDRFRLFEAFIACASGYHRKDGLMIVDRHGRPVYCSNLPESTASELLADSSTPGRPSSALARFSETGFSTDLTDALPESLRSCHISPLKIDDCLSGAALVFPSRERGRAADGEKTEKHRQIETASALIVGESKTLLKAVDIAQRVATSSEVTSVLIEGETGVGKELFSRLIHIGRSSPHGPFIAINCGAITKELFGAELFGHAPGAFTGASRNGKPGVFELADGGVLCLDEIGEMPLELQPFLLRVLEERVVQRIGDIRSRAVNVRLVALTNRDLKGEVEAGRFRRDLFYRISAVSIHIPPLRDRDGDIFLLLDHLNLKISTRIGSEPLTFSPDALTALGAYQWPGNVRELRNLLEKLHVLGLGPEVELSDLPGEIRTAPGDAASRHAAPAQGGTGSDARVPLRSIEDAERQVVKDALVAEKGNLSRAAQRLGISRPTLYRKLDQFGIRRSFV